MHILLAYVRGRMISLIIKVSPLDSVDDYRGGADCELYYFALR